ncbi:MAG TPA: substrate-binding domain-containing protein [Alphaproteobacteria bacterium]|nr:substrate-binding domain-containing protein [Alphaproteobacteria bacterium]
MIGDWSQMEAYRPSAVTVRRDAAYVTPDGRIRIVGYNDMQEMLTALDTIFTASHPGVAFDLELKGTRTAPPALTDGSSAFAPMGAEFSPTDMTRFRASLGSEPMAIRVAHDSLSPQALSAPLGIFVNASNPLTTIAMPQLARIFGADSDHDRVHHWGELGLGGVWQDREIHIVGLAPETAIGTLFKRRLLADREFGHAFAGFAQSREVTQRVGDDALALGFAALNRATEAARPLALATAAGAYASAASPSDLRAGRYPLDRYLYIYIRREADPFVREYLHLVLSRDGQRAIASGRLGYIPLSAAEILQERQKLDSLQ